MKHKPGACWYRVPGLTSTCTPLATRCSSLLCSLKSRVPMSSSSQKPGSIPPSDSSEPTSIPGLRFPASLENWKWKHAFPSWPTKTWVPPCCSWGLDKTRMRLIMVPFPKHGFLNLVSQVPCYRDCGMIARVGLGLLILMFKHSILQDWGKMTKEVLRRKHRSSYGLHFFTWVSKLLI